MAANEDLNDKRDRNVASSLMDATMTMSWLDREATQLLRREKHLTRGVEGRQCLWSRIDFARQRR